MGKLLKGLAIGTVVGGTIGITIGIMVTPELNRKSRKCIRKTRKKLINAVEDTCCNMMNCIV